MRYRKPLLAGGVCRCVAHANCGVFEPHSPAGQLPARRFHACQRVVGDAW